MLTQLARATWEIPDTQDAVTDAPRDASDKQDA